MEEDESSLIPRSMFNNRSGESRTFIQEIALASLVDDPEKT